MLETKVAGVEPDPMRIDPRRAWAPVHAIANHRMTDRREMDSDLVGAAGFEARLHKRQPRLRPVGSTAVVGPRRPPFHLGCHPGGKPSIPTDGSINRARRRGEGSPHQRPVVAGDGSPRKGRNQFFVGDPGQGYYQEPGNLPVEAVDNAPPISLADALQFGPAGE